MKEFIIDKRTCGRKASTYLGIILPNASFGFIQKMIRKKNITLNDKKISGSEILKDGDILKVYFSDETFEKFSDSNKNSINISEYNSAFNCLKGITIVYEDEDYIVLNKPIGVLSQKDNSNKLSLNEWLIGYLLSNSISADYLKTVKPSICNRLDRNTCGLVLCGKTIKGLNSLNKVIKDRSIQKFYHTFVVGQTKPSDVIQSYLNKDTDEFKANIITIKQYNELPRHEQSKYSYIETRFTTSNTYYINDLKTEISMLDIELITGKFHQIRSQFAAIKHPLIGDPKYGSRQINEYFSMKTQALCAYKVILPVDSTLGDISGKTFEINDWDYWDKFKELRCLHINQED